MMRRLIRSLTFNIVASLYTVFCCFALVFAFALPRRAAFVAVQTLYFKGIVWVERIFLGLDYRVLGRENLPQNKSYILAVKHYSMYETLKMPVIFGDIAIILKRELTYIPFWGWYTIKTGMIPVDRGGKGKALASLIEGGKRVIEQKRPILIFPQGTRVDVKDTTAEKPYKIGIAKIAETLNLPVVPVALNSGAFWPKRSFLKNSGVVDFKILPPIPAGLPATDLLKQLEAVLEPESKRLMEHADIRNDSGRPWFLILLLALCGAWTVWWHAIAYAVKHELGRVSDKIISSHAPVISGFPMQLTVTWPDMTYTSGHGTVAVPLAEVKLWPIQGGAGSVIASQGFTADATRNGKPVHFKADRYQLDFRLPKLWKARDEWIIDLTGINLVSGETIIRGSGAIGIPIDKRQPLSGSLSMRVDGYGEAIDMLTQNQLIQDDQGRMARAFFDAMAAAQGGSALKFPLQIKDNVVYAGFLRLIDLTDLRPPAGESAAPPQKNRSGDLGKDAPPAPGTQIPPPAAQP